MTHELKPCPFCGGRPKICDTCLPDSYSDYQQVLCTKCEASIPIIRYVDGKKLADGIARWNSRVTKNWLYSSEPDL